MGSGTSKQINTGGFSLNFGDGGEVDETPTSASFDANLQSIANSQKISEISTLGGGNQATKMIGWNAVPSGFEPLPKSIGGRKRAYQLGSFSGGLNKKTSSRDISLSECTSAINISFGNQGRITVLGDAKLETGATSMSIGGSFSANATGYGAFVFNSAYSLASAPIKGNYEIIARGGMTAGDNIVFQEGSSTQTLDLGSSTNYVTDVAPSIYAQGNGVYACDANFLDLENSPKALILVDRPDINGAVPITTWVKGNPLLNSPLVDNEDVADQIREEVGAAHSNANASGSIRISLNKTSDAGGWGLSGTSETFIFYASYLFDGINETALSTLGAEDGGTVTPTTLAIDGKTLTFNISIDHTADDPAGGDKRINGVRIYYSKASEHHAKKFFLGEASWEDGIKRSTDSVFTPWTTSGDLHDLATDLTIDNPPDLLEYIDLNGYFEDEVYNTLSTTLEAIAPFPVKYKTSTIGADGKVYIANVAFNAGTAVTKIPINQDTMMYSMTGKPGCFPKFNTYESPSVEGGAITALESFSDKILQFREGSVAIVNVSRPQFYVENVFNNIGVSNPCQVCRIPFGIAWANSEGCYLYDGQGVTSLTHGKFKESDWGLTDESVVAGYELDRGADPATNKAADTNGDAAHTPSIGYDPHSKRLVVFKNIENDDAGTTDDAAVRRDGADDAFVYDFMTQSWSEAQDIIAKTAAQAISNFVIYKGNLSFWWEGDAVIQNYSATPSDTQTIEYITKDIDFGAPSVLKKIYKVIVNYYGGTDNDVDVTYGVNGDSTPADAFSSSDDGATDTAGALDYVVNGTLLKRAELTPNGASTNNIYSFQLKFAGTAATTFQIEDITIIYRMKKVK
tara:strand:+ start:590 stop:3154 length:2565 start_codon:yes stop_codon:yes gene_type:complete